MMALLVRRMSRSMAKNIRKPKSKSSRALISTKFAELIYGGALKDSKLEVARNLVTVRAGVDRDLEGHGVLGNVTQEDQLLEHAGRDGLGCPLDNLGIHAGHLVLHVRVWVGCQVRVHDAHERLDVTIFLTLEVIARLGLDAVGDGLVDALAVELGKEGVSEGGRRAQADRLEVIRLELTHYCYSS